ncbi:hypothetical protein N7509_008250 [Penicillium cosmopolitanum]|uniref:L-ornithine N(5)-oxygenase n=1 Tax=Penicillium cosmopolitanum TaxID=1131564 RepID=A0A9W9VM92_9EURO|nr:uncharacterized protein N7509_008250 [Penicillium cosmopolitanum]KAJ5385709.1 hypothetical protein N7509_008250 [Penicillium cosmopolitanum]
MPVFCPKSEFSKVFPSQAEILEYFNCVAAKFDVSRHIVVNTEWEGACWQELTNTWLVKLRDISTGETYYQECKILISAVGGLVNPNYFDVTGIEDFQGDIFHTARWRPEISLRQKNVIVVGNGCSASQLVPTIVEDAKNISQFIRTPQYYLRNENMEINGKWRFFFRYVPGALFFFRILVFLFLESTAVRFNVTGDGLRARDQSAERSRAYIRETAPEKYWSLLMPKYEIGCKILATGFSLTQYDVELIGRNGRTRSEHWNDFGYKEAYKSIAMCQFPNFFYVLGPNSGKSHTSTIYSIENYVDLIIQVIAPVVHDQSSFVEVKTKSEKNYNVILHDAIGKTIFNNSCFSYFIDQTTQKNWFVYPWSSFDMWYDTHFGFSNDWIYESGTVGNMVLEGMFDGTLTKIF